MFRAIRLIPGLVIFVAAVASQAGDGFDFAKTPGKLPKDVVPSAYEITLTPDVDRSTFKGHERVTVKVLKPVQIITLNSLGLVISGCQLGGKDSGPLDQHADAGSQTLILGTGREIAPGDYTIDLDFSGKLGEAAEGLYVTRIPTAEGEKKALATQFEATDARRMFPCWDEPAFRAVFSLKVLLPEDWQAISNMPGTAAPSDGSGRSLVSFSPTPPMATYLLALFAGRFDRLEGEVDGIRLGILTAPGRRDHARYAMEVTKQVLHYYNDYFGTAYPLPKLDQIALPSTGAGGMENWGAISYREDALLYDPAASSEHTRERVYSIVAHEIAHQWFGDLVTMAWWDDLWLNEGFASWLGTKATARFNPPWKTWLRAAGGREGAMHLDARSTTHPIQQPVKTEAEASDAFDSITYQKGESVLRMLESWVGEDKFRAGIRRYMKAHALSNATTADLWQSLEDETGKPVREFARGWTEQPGFPVVKVGAYDRGSKPLGWLDQERFTIHQKNAAPLTWQVPVAVGPAGDPESARVVLVKAATQTPFKIEPGTATMANMGAVGYYRVQYEPGLFKRLLKALKHMAEADRLQLLYDTWALVHADRIPVADFLNLADAIDDTASPTELSQILGVLGEIDRLERDAQATLGEASADLTKGSNADAAARTHAPAGAGRRTIFHQTKTGPRRDASSDADDTDHAETSPMEAPAISLDPRKKLPGIAEGPTVRVPRIEPAPEPRVLTPRIGRREGFHAWALKFLAPHVKRLGWEQAPKESPLVTKLRGEVLRMAADFGDAEVLRVARSRFVQSLVNPDSLDANLRGTVYAIVGREADADTWAALHRMGRKALSTEQRRELFGALAAARSPALAEKTLALSLTTELPASEAAGLVGRVAHDGRHPEAAWDFAQAHLDALMAKLPALGVNDFVPGLFTAFPATDARAAELETWAAKNLPPGAKQAVARTAEDLRAGADFRARMLGDIEAWWEAKAAK
jgi:aminopeptidase N